MINDRVLTNLGLICLLGNPSARLSRNVITSTIFQDQRLNLESKLVALILRNFEKLHLFRYLSRVHRETSWREEFWAMQVSASMHERHITPLYTHTRDQMYVVNPNTDEEMYLYYDLSPSMVIEISRELLDVDKWFLGQNEVFSSEALGDVVSDVRGKYNK